MAKSIANRKNDSRRVWNSRKKTRRAKDASHPTKGARRLVREMYGGEPYEFYALGKYIVAAPGVCGGRPTFKYTRIEAANALDLLAAGWTIEAIAKEWWDGRVSADAIREAIKLARKKLVETSYAKALAA